MLPSHLRGRRPPGVAMFADGRTDTGHCLGDAIRRNSAGQDQTRRTTVAHGSGENRPEGICQTGALQLDLVIGEAPRSFSQSFH